MTKFFAVAGFAAVALAGTPVFGCDWSREASARDAVVATVAAPTEQAAPQSATPTQSANIAADASGQKPADAPTAPVVLVTDRH
jgi:hypothetical protein